VVNPTLLVEVLSDSTEAYGRGKKFEPYRRIPTLQEYLLVSGKESRIEQFTRQAAGRWVFKEATGLDANLARPSRRSTIALAEVFARVSFATTPRRAAAPPPPRS
jgi:Uma2 family endonuclease